MWKRIACIPNDAFYNLFLPKRGRKLRDRGHDFLLPKVRTEQFKRAFVTRCLLNFYLYLNLILV